MLARKLSGTVVMSDQAKYAVRVVRESMHRIQYGSSGIKLVKVGEGSDMVDWIGSYAPGMSEHPFKYSWRYVAHKINQIGEAEVPSRHDRGWAYSPQLNLMQRRLQTCRIELPPRQRNRSILVAAGALLAGLVRYGASPLSARQGMVSFSFSGERGHGPGVNREAYAALAQAASCLSLEVPFTSAANECKQLVATLSKNGGPEDELASMLRLAALGRSSGRD